MFYGSNIAIIEKLKKYKSQNYKQLFFHEYIVLNKMKRYVHGPEEIFVICITDNVLEFRIIKEILRSLKKWAKDLNRYFTKNDIPQ